MIKRFSEFAIKYGLLALAYYIVRIYLSMIKIKMINEESALNHLAGGGKMIAAIWHQRIFIVMPYAIRFQRFRPSVMISQSRDGDIIADIYGRLKFRPVRGSSSRGGKEALAAMIEDLEKNQLAVHVLDGPRGPRAVVKAGIVVLAQSSGVPIFPVYISVDRAWVLNSWDRTLIPKPFSRVIVRWDDPIYVPKDLNSADFELMRKYIEQRMVENQRLLDGKLGWKDIL